MICKNCQANINTDRVKPGESFRCPRCGKVYRRKEVPAPSSPEPARAKTSKPKGEKKRFPLWAGLVILFAIVILIAASATLLLLSGKQAAAKKQDANRTVLRESSLNKIAPDGSLRRLSSTVYSYEPNGLVREKRTDAETLTFRYEYDAENNPSLISWEQDGSRYDVRIACENPTDAVPVVKLTDVSRGSFTRADCCSSAMECLKSYPQYANAKFSYGGLMTQYRQGEAVLGFISEQTVVPDPDGGRTETLSTYDNAAGFTLRETSVYDARDLLVHVTYKFNDVEPVEIGIRYFLEKEPSVPGTRLHGLIAEAKGDLKDALGREIFTYSYDDAGTLLTKESYLSVIHGFKEISLSKKPVERITYGPNGQIVKTESFLFEGSKVSAVRINEYLSVADGQTPVSQQVEASAAQITEAPEQRPAELPHDDPSPTAASDPSPFDLMNDPPVTQTPEPDITATPYITPTPTPTPTPMPTPTRRLPPPRRRSPKASARSPRFCTATMPQTSARSRTPTAGSSTRSNGAERSSCWAESATG